MPVALVEHAAAKVNLTLRVLRRRDDGYHEIESLVAFADDLSDRLTLVRGEQLTLKVRGPGASAAGDGTDNLVLKAVRTLAALHPGIASGAFQLDKRLPVAAGLGGGSADAAAALRLIAQANDLAPDDPRLHAAARATGADVPVCLRPCVRVMQGIGEVLSAPIELPSLPAVLVNPGVALATKDVFAGLRDAPPIAAAGPLDLSELADLTSPQRLLSYLAAQSNDLERPAVALAPVIAEVLAALRTLTGCGLARMSGSGATCFALFPTMTAARSGAKLLRGKYPPWWVRASKLGGG